MPAFWSALHCFLFYLHPALCTAFTLKFMSFKGADICRRLMSICSKTFSPLRSLIDYSEPLGCFRQSVAKVRNVWRPGARLVTIATFVTAPRFSSAFTIWGAFEFRGGHLVCLALLVPCRHGPSFVS